MNDLIVTADINETAINAKAFLKSNLSGFAKVMKPIIPYLLVLCPMHIAIYYYLTHDEVEYLRQFPNITSYKESMQLVLDYNLRDYNNIARIADIILSCFSGYLFAVLAVNWQRLVIKGDGHYKQMSVLNPTSDEIKYALLWVLPIIAYKHASFFASFYIGDIFVFALNAAVIFLVIKISMYFPALATGSNICFGKAFKMSNGYSLKILFSLVRVWLNLILITIAISMVTGIVSYFLIGLFMDTSGDTIAIKSLNSYFLKQPVVMILNMFFIKPLFVVTGVTVLSNYYLHAVQKAKEA